jgi:L-lactate dehydrogenase complex protein LldG
MNSRSAMLAAIKANQPAQQQLPPIDAIHPIQFDDNIAAFFKTAESIGSNVKEVNSYEEIDNFLKTSLYDLTQCVTTITELKAVDQLIDSAFPHGLKNIELAILPALLGIAENSAVWVTEKEIKIRALPFICEHLAIVLSKKNIVSNMHQAYAAIENSNYPFGVFIAGPSKTADIEQSLVLGAHGPKTMTIFLMP